MIILQRFVCLAGVLATTFAVAADVPAPATRPVLSGATAGWFPDEKPGTDTYRLVVRPSTAGNSGGTASSPTGLTILAASIKDLVCEAYGGGRESTVVPADLPTDKYDIALLLPPAAGRARQTLLQEMLRCVFGVAAHRQAHEKRVLVLGVVPGESATLTACTAAGSSTRMGRGQMETTGTSLDMLAANLGHCIGQQIVNDTHIAGRYDFSLSWADKDVDSLAEALRRRYRLDLQLTARKTSILVVEMTGPGQPSNLPGSTSPLTHLAQ